MKRKVIRFERGIPSNFHVAPIRLPYPDGGKVFVFNTNEHYFQACKVLLATGDRAKCEQVRRAATPGAAKGMGRQVAMSAAQRARWDNSVAVEVMLRANLAKFFQNRECGDWLLATGTAKLVEHRPDPIWGDDMDGGGKNQLGLILELVRAVLT